MDCLVLETKRLNSLNGRRYRFNQIINDRQPLTLNLRADPSTETMQAMGGASRPVLALLKTLIELKCSYVSFERQTLGVMSPEGNWDDLEPKLFAALKSAYGFSDVRKAN